MAETATRLNGTPVAIPGEVSAPPANMPAPAPKRLWDRREGESEAAFRAFECFRLQGTLRTMQQAWALYYAKPRPLKTKTRKKPGTPPAQHPPGYFCAWGQRWHWLARAEAWDEHVRDMARDQELDRALAERAKEQEEAIQAARRRRVARREAEAVAGRFFHDLLEGIVEGKKLGDLEFSTKMFLAPRMASVLTSTQRQERLEEGQATERVEVMAEERLAKALAEAIREFVPRESWREATSRITELIESANGGAGRRDAGDGS